MISSKSFKIGDLARVLPEDERIHGSIGTAYIDPEDLGETGAVVGFPDYVDTMSPLGQIVTLAFSGGKIKEFYAGDLEKI